MSDSTQASSTGDAGDSQKKKLTKETIEYLKDCLMHKQEAIDRLMKLIGGSSARAAKGIDRQKLFVCLGDNWWKAWTIRAYINRRGALLDGK